MCDESDKQLSLVFGCLGDDNEQHILIGQFQTALNPWTFAVPIPHTWTKRCLKQGIFTKSIVYTQYYESICLLLDSITLLRTKALSKIGTTSCLLQVGYLDSSESYSIYELLYLCVGVHQFLLCFL